MAVRETNLQTATQDYAIDLSFMNKSKLRAVLAKLGGLLRISRLQNMNNQDSTRFDVEKARNLQMANYDNSANMAHLYTRRF